MSQSRGVSVTVQPSSSTTWGTSERERAGCPAWVARRVFARPSNPSPMTRWRLGAHSSATIICDGLSAVASPTVVVVGTRAAMLCTAAVEIELDQGDVRTLPLGRGECGGCVVDAGDDRDPAIGRRGTQLGAGIGRLDRDPGCRSLDRVRRRPPFLQSTPADSRAGPSAQHDCGDDSDQDRRGAGQEHVPAGRDRARQTRKAIEHRRRKRRSRRAGGR
jgi:hypothetical protein